MSFLANAIVDNVFKCINYDFVICQLGGNDVSNYISPSALRDAFADFISNICETYNVKFVYICSVSPDQNRDTLGQLSM